MTFKYKNVYINETSTITGPYEKSGPLGNYYDKSYNDLYLNEKSFELAEIKMLNDSLNLLLEKSNLKQDDIDMHISGDLLNQISATNYASKKINIPLIGIYAACSTSTLGLALAAMLVDNYKSKKIIVSTSSHNASSEKQFRQPVEYGGPKKLYSTFTVTGAASALISSEKSNIKIESATIGKVVDYKITDAMNMGAAMAPAAAKTIYNHFKNTNTKVEDYDLILTGDLGKYGRNILDEFMEQEYNIKLNNLKDSACMIYDLEKQDVNAGGSGPACIALVTYSYILDKIRKGILNRVLLVATGALLSPTLTNEKQSIPAISHAISIRREK